MVMTKLTGTESPTGGVRTMTSPLIEGTISLPSSSTMSILSAWLPASERGKRMRAAMEQAGCIVGNFAAQSVSKVPMMISLPPKSCAWSHKAKISMSIVMAFIKLLFPALAHAADSPFVHNQLLEAFLVGKKIGHVFIDKHDIG